MTRNGLHVHKLLYIFSYLCPYPTHLLLTIIISCEMVLIEWLFVIFWGFVCTIHFPPTSKFSFSIFNAERLNLIRQQRAEAAKKREEEKAGKYSETIINYFVLHLLISNLMKLMKIICYFSKRAEEGRSSEMRRQELGNDFPGKYHAIQVVPSIILEN